MLDQLRSGYVTAAGGVRVGICGEGATREGELLSFRRITSLALRVPHALPGVARPLLPQLAEGGELSNTLILSPPGLGKTTLLRDLIRCVSLGEGVRPRRVGVADERGELGAGALRRQLGHPAAREVMALQEEIEQKSFNIMISTTKLSARTVLRAVKAAFRLYQSKTSQGKQSVRTLLRQNRGVSSVEISKTGIRGLERYAKKYGIDYAIRKDTSEVPPRYLVFFKAPDAEAFNSAFKEYSASLLNKDKRPSVLAKLHELVQAAAELPGKVRHKEQERGL